VIAIVDYNAGNLTSVRLACEYLGLRAHVTQRGVDIEDAERVIFPGVGAAGEAMRNLRELRLIAPLRAAVGEGKPFLGICLGAQILLERSEEDGGTECMGLVEGEVRRFRPNDKLIKVPQIGWNAVTQRVAHPLFADIEDESEFYFVHSFYCVPAREGDRLGETAYADARFAAVLGRGNLCAAQFHPERSGRMGLKLLENFSKWDGTC
jgi:glutamine amidotransferase